jgi:DNA primase
MAFPPGFLDELRIRVSLPDVVGRKVRLAKKGREYSGLCPFHNEKSPSFTVNEEKGFFHCFGCGAHGDVIGFVMQSQNLGFLEAVEALAGEAGLEVPRATPQERERVVKQKTLVEVMEAAAGFFQAQLDGNAGTAARAYLEQRGLDRAAIERFRLGYAPGFSGGQGLLKQFLLREFPEAMLIEAGLVKQPDDGRDSFDYFRDRVMFPILDRAGRVIAFGGRVMGDGKPKYLNSPDTPLFHKGRVLYGLSWARAGVGKGAELVVTEGYMDVIALHRAGFEGAVAPLGTALTEEQLEELWKLTPEPTLCFDGDAAGQRAASRALDRALPILKAGRSLKFAVLPSGEDPDSLIGRQGTAAMQAVLDGAKPLAEVLFAQELAARPIDTPERRADLTHRLNARAAAIADEGLKREYQFFFRNKLYEQGRPQRAKLTRKAGGRDGRSGGGRFGPQAPEPVSGARLTVGTQAVERRRQEVLVALVLAHPDLLDGHVEEFAGLTLTAPDLDKLRREILNVHAANSGLDAASLQHHLSNHGFVRDVERLLGQQVLAHTQFAEPTDRETTRLGWLQALSLWRNHLERAQELEAAVRRFETDPTEASWARITALQEQAEIERTEQAEFDGTTAGWVSSGRH